MMRPTDPQDLQEAEQEAAQDHYNDLVQQLTKHHELFYRFIGESVGEQWLSDFLDDAGSVEIRARFRLWCEDYLKEE